MRNLYRKKYVISGILVLFVTFASVVYSHCQIPCGIYNDPARFDLIAEHITTIEKSMQQITELSKQDKPNMNQIVRWVGNKDTHADALSEIVTYYFMTQRIKPVDKNQGKDYEEYVKKLTLLHEILVYSMKAKQTTDLSNVEKLKSLSAEFKEIYFGKHDHKH
jgi:nickel superoxide dismutase